MCIRDSSPPGFKVFRLVHRSHAAAPEESKHAITSEFKGQEWRWDWDTASSRANGWFAELAGEAEFQKAASAETLALGGA